MRVELWVWAGPEVEVRHKAGHVGVGRRRELWAVGLEGGRVVAAFGPLRSAPEGQPFDPRPPRGSSWAAVIGGEPFDLGEMVRSSDSGTVTLPALLSRESLGWRAVTGTIDRRRGEFEPFEETAP